MSKNKITSEPIWGVYRHSPEFPVLSSKINADVAVIGAGMTGLSTAYHLIKAGKRVVILEQTRVGGGTTGYSTGNLYAPIGGRLYTIAKKYGDEYLNEVAASRNFGIDLIEMITEEYAIPCQFQRVPFHLFTTNPGKEKDDEIASEKEACLKAKLPLSPNRFPDFPDSSGSYLTLENQAQFEPATFVQYLATELSKSPLCQIFENSQVQDIDYGDPSTLTTPLGKVEAPIVVMATHTPKGVYPVHATMEPYREFAMAVKVEQPLPPAIYWDLYTDHQYSIRPYHSADGDYLIVLGEQYKVGSQAREDELLEKVKTYIGERFHVQQVERIWAAQNYRSVDHLPSIGKSPTAKNTYIATGFAADGLVFGSLAGSIIKDLIIGQENRWSKIYDPSRFTPVASTKNFLKANASVAAHLVKDYLFYSEVKELSEISAGEGKLIRIEGEHLAAYRNEKDELQLVSGICPHMGCVVKWNSAEHSWDCPCHGSRFSTDGKIIEGPALKNLAPPKKS